MIISLLSSTSNFLFDQLFWLQTTSALYQVKIGLMQYTFMQFNPLLFFFEWVMQTCLRWEPGWIFVFCGRIKNHNKDGCCTAGTVSCNMLRHKFVFDFKKICALHQACTDLKAIFSIVKWQSLSVLLTVHAICGAWMDFKNTDYIRWGDTGISKGGTVECTISGGGQRSAQFWYMNRHTQTESCLHRGVAFTRKFIL